MSNRVEPYEHCDGHLGDFNGDRIQFSIKGLNTDLDVQTDILELYLRLYDTYTSDDNVALSKSFRGETIMNHLTIGAVRHPVYVRVLGHASIAFFSFLDGSNYRTLLLGAQSNPPRDGMQDWWRTLICPRLKAFLGV